MNRAEIIELAQVAGASKEKGAYVLMTDELLTFAALIAEDCAKRCEAVRTHHEAEKSTAWSELTRGVEFGVEECVAAIREAYKP